MIRVGVLLCIGPLLCIVAACSASPVVGGECRAALTRCGVECVDLRSDRLHCGACDSPCPLDCVDGRCTTPADAGLDGLVPRDADVDADALDGDIADAAADVSTDVSSDARSDASSDGGAPCPCDLGGLCCDDLCVRPDRDPNHCGSCGVVCASDQVCGNGGCADECEPPLEVCGGLCVSVSTDDPDNCGGCGISCPTGICVDGECSSGVPGHVVLIGHDYRTSRLEMRRVAGNGVFIAVGAEVDVVVFEGAATRPVINGVDRAIDEAAVLRGASWNRIATSEASAVPTLLAGADVFVLYSQTGASDTELRQLGLDLAPALTSFLQRGGVVVAFDGGGAHAGTWQVLDSAGVLSVDSRNAITGETVRVVAAADAVATGVALAYRAERESVSVRASEGIVVVESESGEPVVVHRVVVP